MLLELKKIKKYFPTKRAQYTNRRGYVHAVDDIDLTVQEGENLGLVGESGSGKTTLGRIAMRLIAPTSGQIIFQGKDISHFSSRKMRPFRKNIQMVFQDPFNSLDPRFTVRNILREALMYDRRQNRNVQEKQMADILSAVGLNPAVLNRFPHEFSGGERQRIAIARALIMNPQLLILDEAVSSLDVLVQEQILQLLIKLQKRFALTYFFISHNLRVVKKISQKIAVMYKGKIVELAPTQEIFENPLHPYTRELLSAAIDYQASERHFDVPLNEKARLVDRGNGHFVIH